MTTLATERLPDRPEDELVAAKESESRATDWDLVRQASGTSSVPDLDAVWLKLITKYEDPVRRVLRRHLHGESEAEEATNDFFSELFRRQHILNRADPALGTFRSFIQGIARRYALQWNRASHSSRGTEVAWIDVVDEHARASDLDEEEETEWALAILTHALSRLEAFAPRDAGLIREFYGLAGHPRRCGEEMARAHGTTLGALHVALHRARQKLKGALLDELRPMVTTHEHLEAEMQFLITRLCAEHPGLDGLSGLSSTHEPEGPLGREAGAS